MYCGKCGAYIGDESYCKKCGAQVANARQTPPSSSGMSNGPAPGRFMEFFGGYGRSEMFFAGIILYTAGNVINNLMSFGFFSIVSLLIAALPIAGMWIIYSNSKAGNNPNRALTALSLFRGRAIIAVIGLILLLAMVILGSLLIQAVGNMDSVREAFSNSFTGDMAYLAGTAEGKAALETVLIIMVVVFIVVLIAIIVCSVFYYRAIFNILNGLKSNITRDEFEPIKGITPFSVYTYIAVGFSFISSLITPMLNNSVINMQQSLLEQMPGDMYGAIAPTIQSGAGINIITVFVTLAADIGLLLCVITLHKLNGNIIKRNYPGADPDIYSDI
ncbi:MAG: hypothetical protein LBS19_00025 [Clostridiales bacterium]|jgi:hypothetical protein|nr:hypothetical protein [Clostridiales bacterium]